MRNLNSYINQLQTTKNKGEYIILINTFFELFVEEHRRRFPQRNSKVSIFQIFDQLGAKKINKKFRRELTFYKELRNSLIHETGEVEQHLKSMKNEEEGFIKFIKRYSPMLNIETSHVNFVLEPFIHNRAHDLSIIEDDSLRKEVELKLKQMEVN